MSSTVLFSLFGSIASAVGGQVYFKKAMNRRGEERLQIRGRLLAFLPALCVGLALYTVSMLFWLKTLSLIELSVAFPFLSLNFVGVLLAARFHLGEELGRSRLLGSALVLAGVLLVYLSA